MLVICQQCKKKTLDKKDAVRIDEKNFHKDCAQEYLDKKELQNTVCRVLKLKVPGPKNNMLIEKYHKDGYTYKGMTNALVYHYDIKKGNANKANERIGIIPWVYEEAQEYFKKMEKRNRDIINSVEKFKDKEEEYNYVRVKKVERKPLVKPIEFTNPFEEIEE